jgi:hypothetical protein
MVEELRRDRSSQAVVLRGGGVLAVSSSVTVFHLLHEQSSGRACESERELEGTKTCDESCARVCLVKRIAGIYPDQPPRIYLSTSAAAEKSRRRKIIHHQNPQALRDREIYHQHGGTERNTGNAGPNTPQIQGWRDRASRADWTNSCVDRYVGEMLYMSG